MLAKIIRSTIQKSILYAYPNLDFIKCPKLLYIENSKKEEAKKYADIREVLFKILSIKSTDSAKIEEYQADVTKFLQGRSEWDSQNF